MSTWQRLDPERIPAGQWRARVADALGSGARLASVAGHHDADGIRVVHTYLTPGEPPYELAVTIPDDAPGISSVADLSFSAGRFEREVRDLYGLIPLGHPLPQRLVRHGHWPQGYHPMRSDAPSEPGFAEDIGSFPFLSVGGDGVYEIPVGPIHAGLIEPGHFRFSVVGETILRMKARLWFVHRGVEKLFEGRPADQGIAIAERISGDTAVGHSLAFVQAVEHALGIAVSESVHARRAVLLELERLYNHVADLGAIVNDVGYGIIHAQAQVLRERLLRHNESVTGHRLLRGAITIGDTRWRAIPDAALLAEVGAELAELVAIALGNHVVADRLTGTSPLALEQARRLGTLGYVAKASGLANDARQEHPFLRLPEFGPVTESTGDVLARFQIRAREAAQSIRLIAQLAESSGSPSSGGTLMPSMDHTAAGLGVVEAWRGTLVHRVELRNGAITRCKVVDPSFFNWPALPIALSDTIVPDFPLTNKSFNQSYAGNDL